MPKAYSPRNAVKNKVEQALLENRGRVVTSSELAEAAYGHLENGGPDDAAQVIRVVIHRLRKERQIDTVIGYRIPE